MTAAGGPGECRNQVESALCQQRWAEAVQLLEECWRAQPTQATAAYAISCFARLRKHKTLVPRRLAILRSFTVEPLIPLLRAEALLGGIELSVQVGDFNAYPQEILNPSSRLYAFQPAVVILALQTQDVVPAIWERFTDLQASAVDDLVSEAAETLERLVAAFRSRSSASLVVHTLEQPAVPSEGVLDAQSDAGQRQAITRINERLRQVAREVSGVYLLDYDGLVACYGRSRWHDNRNWTLMRMPMANDGQLCLVREWLRFIHPLAGRVCKVIVTDLDNTLWGGVLAEDGIDGLEISTEGPGRAYWEVQRALLDIHNRGVLLAVCSKNVLADAVTALERHSGMLLRRHHFTVLRINWELKAANLRAIAAELNVGLDALAFVDDNPVERAWIRATLPEVTVVDLPEDPLKFAAAIRGTPFFERVSLSAEDQNRHEYYGADVKRRQAASTTVSVEDFYRSLSQEVEVSVVEPSVVSRVAQLTQKTNQFNLTTRRYTDQEIRTLSERSDWEVWSMRVRDRFGDNGIVGAALVHFGGDACELDTFLLSCRVIGRTVEAALLATVVESARQRGARVLQGWFSPTAKNGPAASFYAAYGFERVDTRGADSRWAMDLTKSRVVTPEWIRLRRVGRGSHAESDFCKPTKP